MIVSTSAIVLHSRRYGDSSRIVTLFSEALGKVTVVAKGARTMKSNIGGSLEPLTPVNITLYHGRNKEMHTLSKAEPIRLWKHIGGSLDRLRSGLLMADAVMRTQTVEQPDTRVYQTLLTALEALDNGVESHAYSVCVSLRLSLAEIMGFGLPNSPAPEGNVVRLSVSNGVVRNEGGDGIQMSNSAYTCVLGALNNQLAVIPDQDQLEIEGFLSLYFSHHLDARITTKAYSALLIPNILNVRFL